MGIDRLIASGPGRQRDLAVAMIAACILHPSSKSETARLWATSTLAREMGVEDVQVEELDDALRWLPDRQRRFERTLAKSHGPGGRQTSG